MQQANYANENSSFLCLFKEFFYAYFWFYFASSIPVALFLHMFLIV